MHTKNKQLLSNPFHHSSIEPGFQGSKKMTQVLSNTSYVELATETQTANLKLRLAFHPRLRIYVPDESHDIHVCVNKVGSN